MKKYLVFLAIFFNFLSIKIEASHIVGGEFSFLYSGHDFTYNVTMNLYYDQKNADPLVFNDDPNMWIYVFSKATDNPVREFELRRVSTDLITYTTNGCASSDILQTRLFKYTGTVNLAGLAEPEGYYIAWERCCRNYTIKNIVQTDFNNVEIAGQVFYLELPPAIKSSARFVNSSPVFKLLPSQYLCKDNFTYLDFGAIDSDGDSLAYRLVTPLKGHRTGYPYDAGRLYPESAPYDSIGWISGYSATNAIHGSPPLFIDKNTGVLGVTPSELGIYAFAVSCDEYRNGIKIGEVRRDFQYLINACPITYSPVIGINESNVGNTTNWENTTPDTIVVKLNKDTCYTIYVTDSSVFNNEESTLQMLYGDSKYTTLPKSVLSFSPTQITVSPTNDTTSLKMCFSTCDKLLIKKDSVYYVDIIVQSINKCPRKSDTLRTYIYVDVEETNLLPIIGTTLDPSSYLEVHPDSLVNLVIYGKDIDVNDIKEIVVKGNRFELNDYGMKFNKIFDGPDSIAYSFTWTPVCDDLKKKLEYKIDFTLKDRSCIYTHNANTQVTLRLSDVDSGLQNLSPPNLITPNGDMFNDCFHLPNLPPDNCTYVFKSVEIYNRWGARIYVSADRNFQWCPNDVTEGIYYYGIDLTEKFIKGWIEVIR